MKPLPLAILLGLTTATFTLACPAQTNLASASTSPLPNAFSTSTEPSTPPEASQPAAATPAPLVSAGTHHTTDISLGVFGDFIAGRNPGYTVGTYPNAYSVTNSQTATPSAGILATFHQQFRPWLGYEVSTSWSRTSLNYTSGASSGSYAYFSRGSIGTDIFGLTAAWVLQGPHTGRFSTFADAGAGLLAFNPTDKSLPGSYVFRPTGVAGLGFNYLLSSHLALRAEYRGLFYKSPDFRYTGSTVPVITRYTLASQPVVSLTYLFGAPNRIPHTAPATPRTHHAETSISLGTFANLTASRIIAGPPSTFTTLSTTPSAGVLGTLRQSFKPWLGYSLNMGYTRTTTHYTYGSLFGPGGTPNDRYVTSNVYELSLAYVAQKHLTPHLTGFVDLGAGMLAYLPVQSGSFVDYRPEGVGGFGVDYHFTPALALRAEYRGQLFKYADFGFEPARHITVASQPTVSLVYTFHAKKR